MTAPCGFRVAAGSARPCPSSAPRRRVVIFACGDPLRGDDSVAIRAVRGMPPEALDGSVLRTVGSLQPDALVDLPAGTSAVIVDAVVGVEPGHIVVMDLAELAVRAERVINASSHQLSLDRVVGLAQLLRDEPLMGRFVGVGIADVRPGAGPGPAVLEALPSLRAAIATAVATLSDTERRLEPMAASR